MNRTITKILCLITLCAAVLALSGCHEEEKAQMISDANAFCEDFKNMDFDAMYALTHDGTKYFNDIYVEGTDGSELIFQAMADNLSYEIGECTIDGENASVNAKISNLDMNQVMSDVIDEYFELCEANPDDIDSIDINEILTKHLNDPETARHSSDTVFNFIKKDGKWVIESNVMIYDDVTGGYMTYYFQVNMANMTTEGQN
jgi:hypothetical protein